MKNKSYSAPRFLQLQKIGFQIEAQKQRKENLNRKKFNQAKYEQKSLSRKRILSQMEVKKNIGNFLQPTKIISVTAHKWVIYDLFSIHYIRGYRAHNKAQLSVFSKLLVFCAINTLIKKHKLNTNKFEAIVTWSVLKMFPEHKTLKVDDILSLNDLLNLMVLDESQIFEVIISANVGAYLQKKHRNEYFSVYDVNDRPLRSCLKYFYELVNSYCKLMQLESIKYLESSPSMRKNHNFCSPSDLAKLSIECLNIPLYAQILKKNQHSVKIKYIDDKGHMNQKEFKVFNKCIEHKFIPYVNVCRNWEEKQFLSSHCAIKYEDENAQIKPILIVLIGSYSPKDRQKDIQQIVEWYLKSVNVLKEQRKKQSLRKMILRTQPVQSANDELNRRLKEKLCLKGNSRYDLPDITKQNQFSPILSNKRMRRITAIKTQQSQQ